MRGAHAKRHKANVKKAAKKHCLKQIANEFRREITAGRKKA
jgi:hypothetical protein